MTALEVRSPAASTAYEMAAVTAACRQTLADRYFGLPLPAAAPKRPEDWFALLHGFSDDADRTAQFLRLGAAVKAWPAGGFEHFALLQCVIVAAPRIDGLAVDETVKSLFAATFWQLAMPPSTWEGQFDASQLSFMEMAKLVTLRRFPAGEMVFDVTRFPGSWLLKVHPLDIPRLIHGLAGRMGGVGPFVSPHLNHWRPNRRQLIRSENERSLWRMARSVARQPRIKGLMADAWFYSAEAGEAFPHLAWLRGFFVEQGATIVDMELAQPDSGVLVGGVRRRQLYADGQFRPRRTLVLWPREDMLAWADRHPELGQESDAGDWRACPPPAVGAGAGAGAGAKAGASGGRLASGRLTLWNAVKFINRRPKLYFLAVIALPSALAGLGAALAAPWWAALSAAALAVPILWMLQYFLLQ